MIYEKHRLLGKSVTTKNNHTGIVIKAFRPTGVANDSVIIRESDGREYVTPVNQILYRLNRV
jgi:hypothetical protein